MSTSRQYNSHSSLDTQTTQASSIIYSNMKTEPNAVSSSDTLNTQNSSNGGTVHSVSSSSGMNTPAVVPSSNFCHSLSTASLLSLSDPMNLLIADFPLETSQIKITQQYSNSNQAIYTPQHSFLPSTLLAQQDGNATPTTQYQQLNTSLPLSDSIEQQLLHSQFDQAQAATSLSHQAHIGQGNNSISEEAVAQIVTNTSVPEFLYQLTKMLTDDHRDIIEWSNAKIEVHNPHRLESEVLNKYFRHSKYASFQRQLNYFGFRKLAGKGKMAPCSYINENATTDLRSLLRMKRKTSATTGGGKEKSCDNTNSKSKKSSKANVAKSSSSLETTTSTRINAGKDVSNVYLSVGPVATIASGKGVKHQLNGFLRPPVTGSNVSTQYSSSAITVAESKPYTSLDPSALAKAAVGKGVVHHFAMNQNASTQDTGSSTSANSGGMKRSISTALDGFKKISNGPGFTFLDPQQLGMDIDDNDNDGIGSSTNPYGISMNSSSGHTGKKKRIQRESSLVALAMIPSLGSVEPTPISELQTSSDKTEKNKKPSQSEVMSFIDFP